MDPATIAAVALCLIGLVTALVAAFQAQGKRIKALEDQVDTLLKERAACHDENASLRIRIASLELKLDSL